MLIHFLFIRCVAWNFGMHRQGQHCFRTWGSEAAQLNGNQRYTGRGTSGDSRSSTDADKKKILPTEGITIWESERYGKIFIDNKILRYCSVSQRVVSFVSNIFFYARLYWTMSLQCHPPTLVYSVIADCNLEVQVTDGINSVKDDD